MPTGPSSSQSNFIVADQPNVTFTSIVTTGDPAGTKPGGAVRPFVGIPDGIGWFDNGDGTITVLVNHELGAAQGAVREHGSTGAFIDRLVVNKSTPQIVSGQDLIKTVLQDNDGDFGYVNATTAFERFCSGDLPPVAAFFNAATGLGTTERIYMVGEETGPPFTPDNGRAWAVVVTGPEAGTAVELPAMGNLSFENLVANPFTGNKTVVMETDDTSPLGQVYMYVGIKQATGGAVGKAGLLTGSLFGVKVNGIIDETNATSLPGNQATFTMVQMPDARTQTGPQLQADSEARGVTEFLRPEDGAWDPSHPNWFYFNTTNSINGPSRLWRLEFTDINNPEAGGTIRMLLNGTEGQRMFDNMTITADGKVVLQEDPGNFAGSAKVWLFDPTSGTLTDLGRHDPARFGDFSPATSPFNQDEESSGVIDATAAFGNANLRAFLLDTQAHFAIPGELVEVGQLQLMHVLNNGVEPRNDFNADGDAGILFQRTDGSLRIEEVQNATIQGTLGTSSPGAGVTALGAGDIDRDGDADLVLRQADGTVILQRLQNGAVQSSVSGAVGLEWQIDAIADVDRDGDVDLLWRRDDGAVRIQTIENGTFAAAGTAAAVGIEWEIAATGDFDRDGDKDVLWRHTDGSLRIQSVQNGALGATQPSGPVGTEMSVVGTGDFDRDRDSDVLVRRADGELFSILIENNQIVGSRELGNVGTEWQFVQIGDFDGDKDSDLLARNNTTGANLIYVIENNQVQSTNAAGTVTTDWHVV